MLTWCLHCGVCLFSFCWTFVAVCFPLHLWPCCDLDPTPESCWPCCVLHPSGLGLVSVIFSLSGVLLFVVVVVLVRSISVGHLTQIQSHATIFFSFINFKTMFKYMFYFYRFFWYTCTICLCGCMQYLCTVFLKNISVSNFKEASVRLSHYLLSLSVFILDNNSSHSSTQSSIYISCISSNILCVQVPVCVCVCAGACVCACVCVCVCVYA